MKRKEMSKKRRRRHSLNSNLLRKDLLDRSSVRFQLMKSRNREQWDLRRDSKRRKEALMKRDHPQEVVEATEE